MTTIALIAAMAKNRVIGKDNTMPWHLSADLKHFKQVTMNKPIIMGRKTFSSIGKALPGRKNIIITQQQDFSAKDCFIAHDPKSALDLAGPCEEVMIIGGGEIYKTFLPLADRLYLTYIDLDVAGDRFFPAFDESEFKLIDQQVFEASDTAPGHRFITLERLTQR